VLDQDADLPGGDLTGYLHGDGIGGWGAARRFTDSPYGKPKDGKKPWNSNISSGSRAFDKARADVRELETPRATDIGPGDRVNHRKFGEGLVLEAGGGFATVMFDRAGRKKLALDVAPLEKICDQ